MRHISQHSIDWTWRLGWLISVCVCVCAFPQRKVPDQDVAQGSYIALPLTLLLLLAAYNHEKVHNHLHLLQTICSKSFSCSSLEFLNLFSWNKPYWNLSSSLAKPEIWNGIEKNVLLPVVFIFYSKYLHV